MSENKRAIMSNLAKVDAHQIQPHEYDEAPELTDVMIDQAKWSEDGKPIPTPAKRGRPKVEAPKVHKTVRMDADVAAFFEALPGRPNDHFNAALRAYMANSVGRVDHDC